MPAPLLFSLEDNVQEHNQRGILMLYKRSTVDKKVTELVDRARELTVGINNTYGFCYEVKKLIVVGDYLDSSIDRLEKVKVGVVFALKERYTDLSLRELFNLRRHTAPQRFSDVYSTGYMWPQEEVVRYLKNRSGIYTFYDISDPIETERFLTLPNKVIFDTSS